jgi:hypothetical protein
MKIKFYKIMIRRALRNCLGVWICKGNNGNTEATEMILRDKQHETNRGENVLEERITDC